MVYDAVIVPGGGLAADGTPHPFVKRRLEEAVSVYKAQPEGLPRPKIICLSCGTTHKPPPKDTAGFPITEAASAAKLLIQEYNIPPLHVLEEGLSLDTIGNAYLLRMIHTDAARLYRLAVITNEFHMERTRAIFNLVFNLPSTSPSAVVDPSPYTLTYITVPDVGMDEQSAEARRAKEREGLVTFQIKTACRIHSLRDLHTFLFHDHMAYASKRLVTASAPSVDRAALSTY